MRISEQLDTALSTAPPDDAGLIIRVVKLSNGVRPAQEAQGILPIFVVGHEGLDQNSWRQWIRENAVAAYGSAMAEKFILQGVDFKDFDPTRPFGRAIRATRGWRSEARNHLFLDQAMRVLSLVERWPSLYNLIAIEMAEEDMTLQDFVGRVYQLPSPQEAGEGRYSTLGDIIGRTAVPASMGLVRV